VGSTHFGMRDSHHLYTAGSADPCVPVDTPGYVRADRFLPK
jgi:hypothetical protein